MNLRPEEICSVIKEQIKQYENQLDYQEVGTVIQVGDGIARIHGLEKMYVRRTSGVSWRSIRDDAEFGRRQRRVRFDGIR